MIAIVPQLPALEISVKVMIKVRSRKFMTKHVFPVPPRIHILGSSCSGKSTLAKSLSQTLNIPHIELDALHWGANWQAAEISIFQDRVANAVAVDAWIIDGSYESKIGTTVSRRRNCIVWLDLGLPLILYRFFKRSLARTWSKELLWGGSKETLRNSIFQKNSLLKWILDTYQPHRERCIALFENPPPGVQVVRLKSPKEVAAFLRESRST